VSPFSAMNHSLVLFMIKGFENSGFYRIKILVLVLSIDLDNSILLCCSLMSVFFLTSHVKLACSTINPT